MTITIPLSATNFTTASNFASLYKEEEKARIIFFNTLAVCAVNYYFRLLKIPTEIEKSHSWNLATQNFINVADLYIKKLGRLECRPVFSGSQIFTLPYETCQDRIGYLAVEIDKLACKAKILGFSENAIKGNLEISQLQPLKYFLKYLECLYNYGTANTTINLSQWYQNLYNLGWQSLEDLIGTEQQNLGLNFRNHMQNNYCASGAKKINLSNHILKIEIALKLDKDKFCVDVFVKPINRESFLPVNLGLVLLSHSGEVIQSVNSRIQDTCIKLKQFRLLAGVNFSILVAFEDIYFQETFQL